MPLDNYIFRLLSYIRYYWRAKSNLYIHSPFVFEWMNVIKVRKTQSDGRIASYRTALKNNLDIVHYENLGVSYQTTVRDRYARTAIDHPYGQVLSATSRYLQANFFLELGTSLGVSTAYIVSSSDSIRGTTIDSNAETTAIAQRILNDIFCNHKVEFAMGYFEEILPNLLHQTNRLDFVFIDGDHSFEGTLTYVKMIKSFLSDNSVIILDDIRWSRDMYRAWGALIQLADFNYTIDYGRLGLLFKVNNHAPKQHFYIH